MLFQSFTFDVDADAGGGAGDGTYLQVILRDDDDVDELEPFAGDDPSRLAQRRTLVHAQAYDEWAQQRTLEWDAELTQPVWRVAAHMVSFLTYTVLRTSKTRDKGYVDKKDMKVFRGRG